MSEDPIYVTRTFLPPFKEYEAYLKKIWNSRQLTNQGPLLENFESKLKNELRAENLHFVANGTLAIQLALNAIGVRPGDEIITTPFTYVATTSAILWEKCKPIFVDIDKDTYNIDPLKIERMITSKTKAILAVHVFGRPCDINAIKDIAEKHNLKVIYDAAHAFGVEYMGESLLKYGDISICSFHATKVFHSIEGGLVVTESSELSNKIELQKRFGHDGDNHLKLGINAKANEFQAAMGLSILPYFNDIVEERRVLYETYAKGLDTSTYGVSKYSDNIKYNYAYFPLLCPSSRRRDEIIKALERNNIFPRKYFYPSLNTLAYVEYVSCKISEDISSRILCLPLYAGLKKDDVAKIIKIINDV